MESDKVVVLFIPVRKGMIEKMKTFYGDILRFTIDGSEFFMNNIEAIRGQLQYSKVKIDPAKNPLFQFNIVSDFPEYCISLRQQGVHFDFVAMTPGGYMAKIFDACDNSILIGCDSFETSSDIGISSWNEYRRY
ncbi:hypothetical protein [Massilia sp. DWR3-1-1]|uniref:hypothetical protein n=1 Tax=Massilia sp. DWR3-1-1 TaxID=2804559 RepID=UPI003CE6ECF7